jgi:hypothetical protein
LQDLLEAWQLTHLVYVIVTDSAANCLGIYNVPGFPSQYKPGRCANHLLQRVIENEIFSMASIKKLIEDVRSVHSFTNISTNFCEELVQLQKEKNPEATPLLPSPDVKTRWNSTHAMFDRSV